MPCKAAIEVEYGQESFLGGCIVCKQLCCCANRSLQCQKHKHCYKKCPTTVFKVARGVQYRQVSNQTTVISALLELHLSVTSAAEGEVDNSPFMLAAGSLTYGDGETEEEGMEVDPARCQSELTRMSEDSEDFCDTDGVK
jgi:hypothetical protein